MREVTKTVSANLSNIKDFFNGKALIWCPTEPVAIMLVNSLKDCGYKWQTGEELNPNKTDWYFFEDDTCYGIDDGLIYIGSKLLFSEDGDYTIINVVEMQC